MTQLTENQISENFDKLLKYLNDYITEPRKTALLKLYVDKEELIALAPASGKEQYHNCFPGGYVEHVINVIESGLLVNKLWESRGAANNHTEEELVFALLNHDLGKIGEGDQPYYVPNPSEWHRKNQGAIYAHNPLINFMPVPDRSLFILQEHGIECSFNEYVAIKTHDGLYDKGNEAYYITYSEDAKLRTNLPYIVHQADMMASRIEYQNYKQKVKPAATKLVKGSTPTKNAMNMIATGNATESATKLFDDLFKK